MPDFIPFRTGRFYNCFEFHQHFHPSKGGSVFSFLPRFFPIWYRRLANETGFRKRDEECMRNNFLGRAGGEGGGAPAIGDLEHPQTSALKITARSGKVKGSVRSLFWRRAIASTPANLQLS